MAPAGTGEFLIAKDTFWLAQPHPKISFFDWYLCLRWLNFNRPLVTLRALALSRPSGAKQVLLLLFEGYFIDDGSARNSGLGSATGSPDIAGFSAKRFSKRSRKGKAFGGDVPRGTRDCPSNLIDGLEARPTTSASHFDLLWA